MARFTKAQLIADLPERADRLEKQWGFDRSNGSAQVRGGNVERAIDYGSFQNMLNLVADIEAGYIGVGHKGKE